MPVFSRIRAGPQSARGGCQRQRFAIGCDIQAVAIGQMVGALLGQAVAKNLEAFAAVVRACDDHAAIDGGTACVGLCGHEPRAIRVVRITRNCESKAGRHWRRDAIPLMSAIGRSIDSAVMLHPQRLRLRGLPSVAG